MSVTLTIPLPADAPKPADLTFAIGVLRNAAGDALATGDAKSLQRAAAILALFAAADGGAFG